VGLTIATMILVLQQNRTAREGSAHGLLRYAATFVGYVHADIPNLGNSIDAGAVSCQACAASGA
jgi:hypothetical protein